MKRKDKKREKAVKPKPPKREPVTMQMAIAQFLKYFDCKNEEDQILAI